MTQTLPKTAADFESALAAFVNLGDTTASLTSIEDGDGNNLANGLYAFVVDNNTDHKEYFVATLTGTALTSVISVSRQGADTTGFSQFHRQGAVVEITDWAVIARILDVLTGVTGFDAGSHLGYDAAPVGLSGNEFATVAYVLGVVSGGTVSFNQQVLTSQTAGENLTANNAIYFKTSDQRWYKADADDSATTIGVRAAFALSTVTTGNQFTAAISGPVSGFTGLTAGSKYYVSQTGGAITATAPVAPAFELFVGWALTTTQLLMSNTPTVNQFAGSTGTPSSTNTFLTQASASAGATDQSQATQNAIATVGEANATTKHNKLAQSFIPTKTEVHSVNLNKQTDTGTFTGTVTVSIQADTAGAPSGVALATKTITNTLWGGYSTGDFLAIFSAEATVTPGNLYWIVVETSTSDNSNHPNVGSNSAGGYANGSVKYNNTTDGWVAISTIDLYFKVNEGLSGKEILGTASGRVPTIAGRISTKAGTLTLTDGATTTLVHGLGKVPALIRASYASASSTIGAMSNGCYDVTNATYSENDFIYNEGTGGASGPHSDRIVSVAASTTSFNTAITVTAVDENIIIFSNSSGSSSIAYEIIA